MVMMCSSTGIAIAFQKVNSYFGLLGGTAGVMMSGGIPAICYFKLQVQLTKLDVLFLAICGVVVLVAGCGAVLSAVDPT
jgi:hypothetical protein